MVSMLNYLRLSGLIAITIALAACGGGGGSSGTSSSQAPSPSISFSSTTFNFNASSPADAFPATQTISATVNNVTSGTVYLLISVSDPSVVDISDFTVTTGTTTGQAVLSVPSPASLGMGTHTARINVVACQNDPQCNTGQLAGSPRTITVNYQIGSPVQQDTMMPSLALANTPGRVVLRGSGFTGVTGVLFGTTPAATATVVNDTELHVDYPAMIGGAEYAVTLQKGVSTVAFGAALQVVDAFSFPAAELSMQPPTGTGYWINSAAFDALHNALLVGVSTYSNTNSSVVATPANDFIFRFAYSAGAWQQPTMHSFPGLKYLALSPDDRMLLAASDSVIDRLDSATLVSTGSSVKPVAIDMFSSPNEYIRGLAFSNDGNVLVSTGYQNGSGSTHLYLYSLRDYSFALPRLNDGSQFGTNLFYYALTGVSGDGSTAVVMEPQAFGGAVPLRLYHASTGRWDKSVTTFHPYSSNFGDNYWTPILDERATRVAFTDGEQGSSSSVVLDGSMQQTGIVTTSFDGILLARDGRRAYVLDRTIAMNPECMVRAFDLTSTPASAMTSYAEVTSGGYPVARPCVQAIGSRPATALSPDEHTLFVVGTDGVGVIPLP